MWRQGVVVGITDAAHGRLDPGRGQARRVAGAVVLSGYIRHCIVTRSSGFRVFSGLGSGLFGVMGAVYTTESMPGLPRDE
jgi:hypothetical protein